MDSSVISLNILGKNSFTVCTPENIQDPFKTMSEGIILGRRRGRRKEEEEVVMVVIVLLVVLVVPVWVWSIFQ